MKNRTLAQLKEVTEEVDASEEIEDYTDILYQFAKPQNFQGRESVEIQYDKQFESMCLILSEKFNVQPKKMKVLEYYNAFENLNEQAKAARK